jgi:hypothetical protein
VLRLGQARSFPRTRAMGFNTGLMVSCPASLANR